MMALENRDDKDVIVAEMKKPIPSPKLHSVMVKAACTYLIDRFGRFM
jgi:hypothetical protein